MFIVKNETFTGLILMAPFLYRRALQMRYIGLLRRPDLSTTGLVSAFSSGDHLSSVMILHCSSVVA